MEIKYDIKREKCITKCPHGEKSNGLVNTVGSVMCKWCKHNVDVDFANNTVTCNFKQ